MQDDGEKEFLGQKGNFSGDEIIKIILSQPACAEFMAKKLCKFFVSDTPEPDVVKAVARHFRDSGYDVSKTLRTVFLSKDFYSPKVMHAQIKGRCNGSSRRLKRSKARCRDQSF